MLRDGSYKQAQDLTPNDSLMPLNRKISSTKEKGITIDGYEMAWSPRSNSWLFTHLLADWYNIWKNNYSNNQENYHRHHVDFNKRNNNPDNIVQLSKDEHLKIHQEHASKTLHKPEVFEKLRKLKSTPAFRQKMSQRMNAPDTRKVLSLQAKEQWSNPQYKKFMKMRWLEFYRSNPNYQNKVKKLLNKAQQSHWSKPENRTIQSQKVTTFFAENPERRTKLSEIAKKQWQNENLLAWRSQQTKQQWTPEFRHKRAKTLYKTYFNKTAKKLKDIQINEGFINLQSYKEYRLTTNDKSLLRFDTFCEKYFGGQQQLALAAVENYNHRIVKIEKVAEKMNVYDLEVPDTHNFALANGVFVHNSAKQGRDRKFHPQYRTRSTR
jgi:DNA gyrase subunit B